MRWLKRKSPEAEAAERWEQHNAEKRAAGCRCGNPATHVRRFGGNVGGVPVEVWSCAEHVNVNSWHKSVGGQWQPAGEFDEATLAWQIGDVREA